MPIEKEKYSSLYNGNSTLTYSSEMDLSISTVTKPISASATTDKSTITVDLESVADTILAYIS